MNTNHFMQSEILYLFPKMTMEIVLEELRLNILQENNWSGNVRELQNTLERAIIFSKDGVIKPAHLFFEKGHSAKIHSDSNKVIVDSLEVETKKIIKKALELTKGKIYGIDGAAALLRMKPTTLQSKIKKLKITQ